ncbi:PREDICTED: pleckstrin homology domain-containing family A member 3-like isoform X2 [Nicrophorus vespilloides]|uniref:Pleckstrin homology domain-containing family A member 3-like isoform X2 n=1 Tax=Nicrophorus vespilloides TaxID=110193 RepID=A0ABM1ML27_NICVS|nr:PREDICTED: pleckstrin homology domain-containing family A member 3-like isoform X2 [Nicrophorus vespilloides]
MEGTLWKWTNYWNGWQTRWFVYENGILSYYKSKEDVSQGCKGSMKISACEINASTTDMTRVDLGIPGERHIYLKAATMLERQSWISQFESAKSFRRSSLECQILPSALKSKKSELRVYCDLLMQQVHTVKMAINSENGPEVLKMDEATRLLGATCNTFINTLEECMKLANSSIMYEQMQTLDVTSHR